MLASGLDFVRQVFSFLVSVVLSGFQERMVVVSCLVINSSRIQIDVATGGSR